MSFDQSLEKWQREKAALCRYRQLVEPGPLIDDILADAAMAFYGDQDELLTLGAAAQESGYNPDHLGRLVREGKIPDRRPPGHRGRVLIRRGDLPRRPAGRHTESTDEHEPACKGGPIGHS